VEDLGVGRLDTDVAAVRATSPAIGNGPKFGGASGHLVKAAMQVGDEVDGTPGIGKLAKTSCRHAPDAVNGLMKDQQFLVAEHAGTTCRKPHSSPRLPDVDDLRTHSRRRRLRYRAGHLPSVGTQLGVVVAKAARLRSTAAGAWYPVPTVGQGNVWPPGHRTDRDDPAACESHELDARAMRTGKRETWQAQAL
jgi:hypothetical protein